MKQENQNLISICICTYKRPEFLKDAIEGVLAQEIKDKKLFTYEIVIIDNDDKRSAESVVKTFQDNSQMKIIYDCEPEQNIALTRNRAVKNANGNFITFIDDDEVPVKNWVDTLFQTLTATGADGVLGPVLSFFPEEAPKWLNKCNLFDRKRFSTGTILTDHGDTRTGNVLLSRALFPDNENWFDPAFGRTGGEDVDFFKRKMALGKKFVWCDEAVAYETIPPERWKGSYYIKRYFKGGIRNGDIDRKKVKPFIRGALKSIVAIPVWLLLLVCLLPLGKHVWFRPILKISYFSGYILSFLDFSFFRVKD